MKSQIAKYILITGATGFIGAHTIPFLRQRGFRVAAYTHDVTEPFRVRGAVDVVLHLAAKTFIPWCTAHPAETFRVNVGGTLNALECAREKGARFVLASAAAVYGVSRERIAEDTPLRPASAYGASKQMAEQISAFYARSLGVPCMVARLFNVYGKGQRKDFLIPSLAAKMQKGEAVELRSPKSVRDYLSIDDVTAFFLRCMERFPADAFAVFNVGSGEGKSVREVAVAVESAIGTKARIVADETAVGDTCTADISRAKKVLGWAPKVSFSRGLKQVIA